MLELLVGAGIFAGGMAVGRVAQVRSRPRTVKSSKPVCGCEHELAYHDPKTGECHAEISRFVYDIGDYQWRQCTCCRYTGPEPLTSYYAPELLP